MDGDKNSKDAKRGGDGQTERDLQGQRGGGVDNEAFSDSYTTAVDMGSSLDGSRVSVYTGSNDFMLTPQPERRTTIEAIKSVIPWTKRKLRGACTRKLLTRRLPILRWLPAYDGACAVGDLVAGLSVGLTVIPQALAYANIAGLPPQYGLYGSFAGCLAYIVLGGCKDVPMGPTAIQALLTAQAIRGLGVEHAILLCFLTGCVQLAMGVFGLGFLIDFISGPVSSGFTSAAALIIVTSQVKDVLGITASGATFVDTWRSLFSDIHNTRVWDTVLGICCIAVLLIMRIIGTFRIGPKGDDAEPSRCHKIVNKSLWLFGTSRNALLVIVCGFIGYSFCLNGEPPFKVIGTVPAGLPNIKSPPFGFSKTVNTANGTESIQYTFGEMISNLGSGIVVVPLVGLLESIAICKAFSKGQPVDATQELVALGAANVVNSFVQAFPGTGSLSRSAVSNASGAKTPLSGLYVALLVVTSLLVLTPAFQYVPKAALGAVIIAAVVFMVEVKVVRPMWRSKKSDLLVWLITLVACLVLPLEQGIAVGVGINLLFILYHAARPKISVEKLTAAGGTEYLMLTPDRCLIFPSTDYVRNLVTKHSIKQAVPVVIDCSHIYGADYTAAMVVESLTKDFASREQPLLFYNLKPSVSSVFEGLSPKDFVVFYNHDDIDEMLKNWACVKKQLEGERS